MSKSKELAKKYLEDKDIEALFKACLQHTENIIKVRHCSTNQDYANAVKEGNDIWKAAAIIINKTTGHEVILKSGYLGVLEEHVPFLFKSYALVDDALNNLRNPNRIGGFSEHNNFKKRHYSSPQ
jgi:hypothetical protein